MQRDEPAGLGETHIAIIGAGFGGIGAAIQLRQAGFDDLVILERADAIGGTWRDNTYPGCTCDVQSHLYAFSFAPNPDWSRSFSPRAEIRDYLNRLAEQGGVMPHVRTGCEVTGATWDAEAARWRIATTLGPLSASVLVLATGALSDPALPALPGLDSFAGPSFHSSQWDHGVELAGRRVAVVGTGASAIQFVPEIQPRAASLTVYQRTAPWVVPRRDRVLGRWERALYRRVPALRQLVRGGIYLSREALVLAFRRPAVMERLHVIALRHLRSSVPDPVLRARLTPRFTLGCKRVLISNDYFPALIRPNVEVVTEAIAEVRPDGIVASDGAVRPADVIIFGTGFRPTDPPLAGSVRGRDGRTLAEGWGGSPRAHLGMTVAGYPNLFLLMGPNTGTGHTSVLYMLEAQFAHLLAALRHMREHRVASLEPRAEAQAAFVAEVDRRLEGTVWTSGSCASWYLDGTGRNSALWPDFTWRYRRRLAGIRPEEYLAEPATP